MSSCRWYLRVNSSATQAGSAPMPSPPRGPVPTSTRRRTRSGRARATSWATRPPIECPTTSIVVSPSASMKVIASRAIASMVPGTVPLEEATPALLNKMTSRSAAKASLRAGSWSSRVPMKCWKNTSGGRSGTPRRRYAKRIPPASTCWVRAASWVNLVMTPASPPGRLDGIRNVTALLPVRHVQSRCGYPAAALRRKIATRHDSDGISEMNARPTIVLIHGAWADGSCWSGVIERLQAEGYHVTAPQFPLTALADDVARLRQVLDLQDGPVIVAGHSYGGQVMTALGADAPNV